MVDIGPDPERAELSVILIKMNEKSFTQSKKMTAEECYDKVLLSRQAVAKLQKKYSLHIGDIESTNFGATEMIARSPYAAVRISCSPRDTIGLNVVVGRLVDGNFPKHPRVIDENTVLYRFDLRDIALLREGEISKPLREKIHTDASLTAVDISTILDKCCSEILRGDFSIFDEASAIVKNRDKKLAKEFPV